MPRAATAGTKRAASYRVDDVLLAAVAAKAAGQGETVTDVIVRAFTAYIQDAAAPAPARSVASPGRVRFREPAPSGQCPPHPKARVIKGFCHACGRSVLND